METVLSLRVGGSKIRLGKFDLREYGAWLDVNQAITDSGLVFEQTVSTKDAVRLLRFVDEIRIGWTADGAEVWLTKRAGR